MVGGILSSEAFKLGNVGGELGWHSRPTNIMADRIIYQLIEIRETEACHEGGKGAVEVVLEDNGLKEFIENDVP